MQKRVIQKADISFTANLSNSIVLVIHPSKEFKDKIFYIGKEIVSRLPGRIEGIYFLGSNKKYTISIPRDFEENFPRWFNDNENRVNLISPIFEEFEKNSYYSTIAVICSSIPYDLDDWNANKIIKRTLFINVSDNHSNKNYYTEINLKGGISEIINALNDPAINIQIRGQGFIPIFYEIHSKGKIETPVYKKGEFIINIILEEEFIDVHLKAFFLKNPPYLYIKREKGVEEKIQGKIGKFIVPEIIWQELPKELIPVFEAFFSKSEYICYQCGKKHLYTTLVCPEGSVVLKNIPLGKVILFNKEYMFYPLSDFAFVFEKSGKIITNDGKLYKLHNEKLDFIKNIELCEEVEKNVFALYH
ncbi:MAG TPA: hypothetical protein P5150_09675, partial [Candidatus Ratteibacteria bacterium]|nr:hypothetical protein [Candidatus Ratteibacteria bacterium]